MKLDKADKWQEITNYIDSRPVEQKEGARLMLERLKPEIERLEEQIVSDRHRAQRVTNENTGEMLKEIENLQRKIAELEEAGEKEPFPELEDIKSVMVDAPEWINDELVSNFWGNIEFNKRMPPEGVPYLHPNAYRKAKEVYENSKDFTVTWELKETDPRAEWLTEVKK